MQKLQIIGRVGKDASVNTVNGKEVANFPLAVSRKINGEEKTSWYEVALWDRPKLAPYIKKGRLVYVEGEPSIRQYTTTDGRPAASIQVRASSIELLSTPEHPKREQPAATQFDNQDGLPW